MKEFTYTVKDELGIHARTAGLLAKEAKNFSSEICVIKNEQKVNVTRLMALMKLNVKQNEEVKVSIEGADEERAFSAIKSFFEKNL